MSDGLVFPDVRECLNDLIDGTTHLETIVRSVFHLQADDRGSLLGPFPLVQVVATGGTESYVDRVDRVTLDCYAPGQQAVNTLESVKAFLRGTDIETPHGYLDEIRVDQVPTDIPYQSETLNKATATFLVTSRPI